MSIESPKLPDYPSHDYLNYQELYGIALDLLKYKTPRAYPTLTYNGQQITSLEDIESQATPYKLIVNFKNPLKPSSDLFQALKGVLDSNFKSTDDIDTISEHLLNSEKRAKSAQEFDYQTLTMNIADFLTMVIREWQTNRKANRLSRDGQKIYARDTVKFSDQDGFLNFFDENKLADLMASENPYIDENYPESLYTQTPEESPDGITMLHIDGLVTRNMQYVFGYIKPNQIIPARNLWEEELYNNLEFNIENEYLFKIIVAFLLTGVPDNDFLEDEYLE